jgi:exodeoxyribonuclease III
MAFRKKLENILAFSPDILIVPECEHIDKIKFPENIKQPTDKLWFGKNQNKGLAVFSFSSFRFSVLKVHNEDYKMIIPISVTGGKFDFTLFAIWANNPADPDGHYITQIWKALNYYNNLLSEKPTILMGDFNSNTIWDYKKHRLSDHSSVVRFLETKKIHSIYHKFYCQEQGKESHPTLFMYRHKEKPYHIDYCFASAEIVDQVSDVHVGGHEIWAKYSDHSPLIVTIKE